MFKTMSSRATAGFCAVSILAAAANADFSGLTYESYVGTGWIDGGYSDLTTYRVYANFTSEDDRLVSVFGTPAYPLAVISGSGQFYNPTILDSLTAPADATPAIWLNQWDTYVTIDTDTATGDETTLSPGFGEEVGYLTGDFSTTNASFYLPDDSYPQGLADGYRVMMFQLTVNEGQDVDCPSGNLMLGDGTVFSWTPTPASAALLGIAWIFPRRRRRRLNM